MLPSFDSCHRIGEAVKKYRVLIASGKASNLFLSFSRLRKSLNINEVLESTEDYPLDVCFVHCCSWQMLVLLC